MSNHCVCLSCLVTDANGMSKMMSNLWLEKSSSPINHFSFPKSMFSCHQKVVFSSFKFWKIQNKETFESNNLFQIKKKHSDKQENVIEIEETNFKIEGSCLRAVMSMRHLIFALLYSTIFFLGTLSFVLATIFLRRWEGSTYLCFGDCTVQISMHESARKVLQNCIAFGLLPIIFVAIWLGFVRLFHIMGHQILPHSE